MDLYGIPYSPACGRVQFALEVKRLKYKYHRFTPRLSDGALKRVAGRVEIPTLIHKEVILRGDDEIIDYLETEYPEKNIRGRNESEMAAIQRYIEVYHELHQGLQADVMIRFRRNVDEFSRDGPFSFLPKFCRIPAANWLLERLDEIWACNTTNFQKNRENILASLRTIAPQLRPSQPLVGDTITDADIAFCELGSLFRPEHEGRNDLGRHSLSVLHAEWLTPDVSHPYEVWRDSIRQLFESTR